MADDPGRIVGVIDAPAPAASGSPTLISPLGGSQGERDSDDGADTNKRNTIIIDPHTGERIPVISDAGPPSTLQIIRDYLGIKDPKTTPLDLELLYQTPDPQEPITTPEPLPPRQITTPFTKRTIETVPAAAHEFEQAKKTGYDIRSEVFGTGMEEELRRVIGRGFAGVTGGLSDLFTGGEKQPDTLTGAVAGGAAEFAGFLFGPMKAAKFATGTRFKPNAEGLRFVVQKMTEGAAHLGIASSLSAIIPSFMESENFTEMGQSVLHSGAIGGITGLLYPTFGFIENKALRVSVALATMDKLRAGPDQWFQADDIMRGIMDGSIDRAEMGRAAFSYLMDIYFTLSVPSMKKELSRLNTNAMVKQIDSMNPQDALNAIMKLKQSGDIQPDPVTGVSKADMIKILGSKKNMGDSYNVTDPTKNETAHRVERMYNNGDRELSILRDFDLKKTRQAMARLVVDVSGEVKKQLLERGGVYGREAVIWHDLIRGSSAKSDMLSQEAQAPIYGDLTQVEGKILDRIIQSRRTIAIDESLAKGIRMVPLTGPAESAAGQIRTLIREAVVAARPKPEGKKLPRVKMELSDAEKAHVEETLNFIRTQMEIRAPAGREGGLSARQETLLASVRDKVESIALPKPGQSRMEKTKSDLTKEEKDLIQDIVRVVRRRAPEEKKATIQHPEGLGGNDHKEYLKILETRVADYAKLNERADLYFSEMKKNVDLLFSNGLIDKDTRDNLVRMGDYSPRQFIQHIDPSRSFDFGTGKISVPDSGLKAIELGSTEYLENNSRAMLNQVIARTTRRIARKQANDALWELSKAEPGNGVVRNLGPSESPRAREEVISTVFDGKQVRLAMPRELAKQWVEMDPDLTSQTANILGWVSGTNILKPMATGLNPEFVLTNMPRDIAHVWLSTQEYSPHIWKFAAQMSRDYAETAKDAFRRSGAYVDYINEGGGMSFLTHQGRVTGKLEGVWGQIQTYLGYAGETSEIWTRLALRNRALRNGKQPHEATWTARNYLDFAQGGSAIKAADSVVPYLNASIQGSRGLLRGFKDAPLETGYKVSQIAAVSTGLYLANRFMNPDALNAVTARDKANNFIITTPFTFIDEEGNKRWLYFRIAKDQSQRVFSTMFESLMAKSIGDPVNSEEILSSFESFLPIVPTGMLPPTLDAMIGYATNTDFWLNDDIWRGKDTIKSSEEWTKYTHPLLKGVGSYTGLSPERTRYALENFFPPNIYSSVVSGGTAKIFQAMGDEAAETSTMDFLNRTPFLHKILKATNPFEPYKKLIEDERTEADTRKFVVRRELDDLSEKFYQARADGNSEKRAQADRDVRDLISKQPAEEKKALIKRHIMHGKIFKIPDRLFWLNVRTLSPESRAHVVFSRWAASSKKDRERIEKAIGEIPGVLTGRFDVRLQALKDKLRSSSDPGKIVSVIGEK